MMEEKPPPDGGRRRLRLRSQLGRPLQGCPGRRRIEAEGVLSRRSDGARHDPYHRNAIEERAVDGQRGSATSSGSIAPRRAMFPTRFRSRSGAGRMAIFASCRSGRMRTRWACTSRSTRPTPTTSRGWTRSTHATSSRCGAWQIEHNPRRTPVAATHHRLELDLSTPEEIGQTMPVFRDPRRAAGTPLTRQALYDYWAALLRHVEPIYNARRRERARGERRRVPARAAPAPGRQAAMGPSQPQGYGRDHADRRGCGAGRGRYPRRPQERGDDMALRGGPQRRHTEGDPGRSRSQARARSRGPGSSADRGRCRGGAA